MIFWFHFLVLTGLAATSLAAEKPLYDIGNTEQLFEDFMKTYGKSYSGKEKQRRLKIFEENLKKINRMNSAPGNAVYDVGIFSDLTEEEFINSYTGFKPRKWETNCTIVTDDDITTNEAPSKLDWRDKNIVNRVKHQKTCGSCWAFASIANIEGQYAMKYGKMLDFSEQLLVDCAVEGDGCMGYIMDKAMSALINLGGVESQEDYPYVDKQQKCSFDQSKVKAKLSACNSLQLTNEDKIKEALYKMGPLVIGLDGRPMFQYKSGILDCGDNNNLNHAVLLVGYDSEDGVDYWQIKNSWGESFGEKGYVRVRRNINACGLVNDFAASAVIE